MFYLTHQPLSIHIPYQYAYDYKDFVYKQPLTQISFLKPYVGCCKKRSPDSFSPC